MYVELVNYRILLQLSFQHVEKAKGDEKHKFILGLEDTNGAG